MPKKANITNEQVEASAVRADDMAYELRELADEIRAGRCDDLVKAVDLARKFTTLARLSADVAGAILTRKGMADDRAELEAKLRTETKA